MKNFLRSRWVHSGLGLLVSGVLVACLVVKLDWNEVGAHIVHFNYWYFIPILPLWAVHFWLRALRWRYLLASGREIPMIKLFDGIMLGNFGTYVLPLRAGEFIRPFLVSHGGPQSYMACFVSVVIERFFDLAVVLILFGVMVLHLPGVDPRISQGAGALSLLALGIFLFIALSISLPGPLMKLVDFCLRPLPETAAGPIHRFLSDFLSGSHVLRDRVNFINVIVLSGLVWFTNSVIYYVWCFGFGIQATPWYGVAFTVVLALAVAAPSAPGFLGVYEWGCIATLKLFGVSAAMATSYAIISHVFQYVFVLIYGGWVLIKYGIRFSELRTITEQEREVVAGESMISK